MEGRRRGGAGNGFCCGWERLLGQGWGILHVSCMVCERTVVPWVSCVLGAGVHVVAVGQGGQLGFVAAGGVGEGSCGLMWFAVAAGMGVGVLGLVFAVVAGG